MTYVDSALLQFTERVCRQFQVWTGRTNVWLAFQLTNLSIVIYFIWVATLYWLSGDVALRAFIKAENGKHSTVRLVGAGICHLRSGCQLELPRQFDRSAQEMQIMIPRNLDAAKLLQMRCQPLCIEQCEFPGAQMLHQRN